MKFNQNLIPLIVSKQKTATWRLFDDKNLSVGDTLELLNAETREIFAKAKIVSLSEKPISQVSDEDRVGHEPVGQGIELLKHYETLYKKKIDPNESIKIIRFELI